MTNDDQLKTVRKKSKKKFFHSLDEIEKEFFPNLYARKQENLKHRGEAGRCEDCGAELPRTIVFIPRS